ncbi:MAG: peroxiredoxin [Gemmatimonadaceae bacterium]|nr:peroxiredoxin [Chitinophagaceae bacterium]
MSLSIGQAVPELQLHDSDRKLVKLRENESVSTLLLFFPLAFTSVCTKELCNVRDALAVYNKMKTRVLGISVDSPATLAKFKTEQGINFPLLSDFNREAGQAFDCLYDAFGGWMKGVHKRSAFVFDSQGIIKYAEVLENAGELPDFEKIDKTLKELAAK